MGSVNGELKIFVNNELIVDIDGSSEAKLNQEILLLKGSNEFRVEYKNHSENSYINFEIEDKKIK
ncbi:hypothetical protein ACI2OX_19750 [Bacillus sp. N9]